MEYLSAKYGQKKSTSSKYVLEVNQEKDIGNEKKKKKTG